MRVRVNTIYVLRLASSLRTPTPRANFHIFPWFFRLALSKVITACLLSDHGAHGGVVPPLYQPVNPHENNDDLWWKFGAVQLCWVHQEDRWTSNGTFQRSELRYKRPGEIYNDFPTLICSADSIYAMETNGRIPGLNLVIRRF